MDELEQDFEPKDSAPWLGLIKQAEKQFDRWRHLADRIDRIYSGMDRFNSLTGDNAILDREFDLFWASVEVIKPSIYSRPPVPVVTPKYNDRSPIKRVTADLLERSALSAFGATDIDGVMLGLRDDLVIVGRGTPWVTYEDDGEDEKVCVEHIDRLDFLHDPARKWSEVCWVARRAWMTRAEMRERFQDRSGDLYLKANYSTKKDHENSIYGADDNVDKAGVWEIWHKTEDKVVWVCEGCDKTLDEDEPHLKLKGFFPAPRPAYGTLQRRTLVPVPLLVRIQNQLESINLLTSRIHDLVNKLVVKGIIPAGTDVGDAVEMAMREENASSMLIPVPSLSMSGATNLVEWLPIDQVANTILAAVQARRELIGNVQELLGIADIMRGDTEAQETATAQTIKVQYGSVRVRDMIGELVRVARDCVRIMAEIMAEEFSLDTLLKMAQMELPTEREIKQQLKEIEKSAEKQLAQLEQQAVQALQGQTEQDPEKMQAAQQQLQQAQQQIVQEAQAAIAKLSKAVTQEQVKELLEDSKTDPFIFDIETDSTIYPDEQAAKQAVSELGMALSNSMPMVQSMVQMGGADAAGELLKMVLAPYRPSRTFMAAMDELIERLKENPPQGEGVDEAAKALAESQMVLAQAEAEKARAQTAKVQADSQLKAAELESKQAQMQADFQEKAAKLQLENGKLEQKSNELAVKYEEIQARIDNIRADTMKKIAEAGVVVDAQALDEFKSLADIDFRQQEQVRQDVSTAMNAESQAFDQQQRVIDGERQDRNTDRQMTLAERQAQEKGNA